MTDIDVYSTAREMARAVRERTISARELLELHLDRIAEVNPAVNAVVSMDPERSRAAAAEADERTASGAELGPLHGLPHAFKDTHEVAGWTTTFGSPLRETHVPKRDELIVERIRAAGAVVIGKTNVPEWAAGSHTFNPIFGTTLNPYDLRRSAGGSSGGAAAALASGMVPLADGSDMGGSLRNPASFCNVVGLRPSVGRVPAWPTTNAWEMTSVGGPMARNVEDLALLLSVIAGPSTRAPMSLESPGHTFAPPLAGELRGLRVALSTDLGGAFQVDDQVAQVVRAQGDVLSGAGAQVSEDHLDVTGAEATFRTLRAWLFQARFGALLERRPEAFKASLADNIRAGEGLTGSDVATAYQRLTTLAEKVRVFFEKYDVLVLPVSQVPPFDAGEEYPATINGQPQETYLDWMRSAFLITVTGCPALSVPAGFTREGWPVGVQVVAAPRNERLLLEVGHAFEQLTRAGDRRPALTPVTTPQEGTR
jgi:amidase